MSQILEYIAQHYIWFLSGAVLILLAIIGYYADKTNFGQGKDVNKEKEEPLQSIDRVGLADITNDKKIENNNVITETNDGIIKRSEESLNNALPIENTLNKTSVIEETSNNLPAIENNVIHPSFKENDIVDEINAVPNLTEASLNSKVAEEKKDDITLAEEKFNKFNEEFNSILPEKNFLNTDLLSDIDDLELGKTQKIDLSQIPDLGDIELPKIKNLVNEEQDIWKF